MPVTQSEVVCCEGVETSTILLKVEGQYMGTRSMPCVRNKVERYLRRHGSGSIERNIYILLHLLGADKASETESNDII